MPVSILHLSKPLPVNDQTSHDYESLAVTCMQRNQEIALQNLINMLHKESFYVFQQLTQKSISLTMRREK